MAVDEVVLAPGLKVFYQTLLAFSTGPESIKAANRNELRWNVSLCPSFHPLFSICITVAFVVI